MEDVWISAARRLSRPARLDLPRCLRARAEHVERLRARERERASARSACEAEIERERARVFGADDGVVSSRMTELERAWRRLSRTDPEAGLMDLWAEVVPRTWVDRKRWRESPPSAWVDAAVALASDVPGVEAAEGAARRLSAALSAWGVALGPPRFRLAPIHDVAIVERLLREPLKRSLDGLLRGGVARRVVERAHLRERAVCDAARAALCPGSPLAAEVAHGAFVADVLRAARLDLADPTAPLADLLRTGYAISSADASALVLIVPPI